MKIISGVLKGRKIPILKNSKFRPSTGKFKESLFSILASLEANLFFKKNILDLFAGSGSLGLEALSRGAAIVTLIDIENENIKVLKEFVDKIDIPAQINCLRLDATNLPSSRVKYDIVFIDPPYYKKIASAALKALVERDWLSHGSIIVLEVEKNEVIKVEDFYLLITDRIIGKTRLVILRYLNEAT